MALGQNKPVAETLKTELRLEHLPMKKVGALVEPRTPENKGTTLPSAEGKEMPTQSSGSSEICFKNGGEMKSFSDEGKTKRILCQ